MIRRLAVATLAMLTLGCAASDPESDQEPSSAPPTRCGEWTHRAVTSDDVKFGCTSTEGGSRYVVTATTITCDDHTVVFENELGWGYIGGRMVSGTLPAERAQDCAPR